MIAEDGEPVSLAGGNVRLLKAYLEARGRPKEPKAELVLSPVSAGQHERRGGAGSPGKPAASATRSLKQRSQSCASP